MKGSFEERLTGLAGAENFTAAKQLLKKKMLVGGAWRDREGFLCGRFRGDGGPVDVRVETGAEPRGMCSCGKTDRAFCEHAAALVMYAGRFSQLPGVPVPGDEAPSYYGGLRRESFTRLGERLAGSRDASLAIDARSVLPHAPSKWENIALSVRLRCREREYQGNLYNLRLLYFDKVLGAALRFDDLSLQDQQIVRFLATNGVSSGSQITLDAELSAELFHCLIGHPRFFRNGQRLTVRGDRAEAVILLSGNRIMPGLRVDGSVLAVANAKIVAGRAGCWIGCGSEYFFLPATCELSFLRNFFRSGVSPVPDGETPRKYLERFPFPVIDSGFDEPETLQASVLLDGDLTSEEELVLRPRYIYDIGEAAFSCRMRSGEFLADGKKFLRRDTAGERRFEQMLEMAGFVLDERQAVLRGSDAIGLFLDRILPEYVSGPSRIAFSPSLGLLLRGGLGVPEPELRCRISGRDADGFRVSYDLSASGRIIDWRAAAACAESFREYMYAPEAGMIRLSPAFGRFFRAAGGAVKKLDTALRTFEIPLFNARYYAAIASEIPGALPPELGMEETPAPVPAAPQFEFKGVLRPYQERGVAYLAWMTDRNLNVILADEMGLGKTVQLLALLASRLGRDSAPALIVCPASLAANWEREAARFVPALRTAAPRGGAREECLKNPGAFDLLILSYTSARLSRGLLRRMKFSYLVLDEAQHIKNPGTSNARSCKDLTADHKIVLSGTPLENSPEDLWSIMDFLHPGMLGTLASFRRRCAGIADSEERRTDLARRVGPFIMRRTKAEVASDLPPRTEKILFCDFSPDQRALYDRVLAEGRREIARFDSGDNRRGAAIFTTLLRLRQICCDPRLLPGDAGKGISSAKMELLNELLHENIDSSHKMLLFSQFPSLLHLIVPELENAGIPFEYLDGSTTDRMERVDRFNSSPGIPLFLLSLKAGGTGLNLTSADTVIIYDPWWNPAAELQAADRSHRIGQSRPVTICRLVVRDSVEEKILELQGRKRRLFDAVVEASASESGLSLEELSFLIENN